MEDTTTTETLGKLPREALLLYVDTSFGSGTSKYFLVGKHVEDLSVELNPDTESIKNILGESVTNDNGYEPSIDVDTYYANPSDGDFYTKIKDIAMNRLTGDKCMTKILEVLIDKKSGAYDAWLEDAMIKPQSYGGSQGGISIPYNIALCGNRTKGTVTMVGKEPTFTPGE